MVRREINSRAFFVEVSAKPRSSPPIKAKVDLLLILKRNVSFLINVNDDTLFQLDMEN